MTSGPTGTGSDPGVPPVAADRPFVDGARTSSEDLRAEAEAHAGDGDVERLRLEVADTVTELTARVEAVRIAGTRRAATMTAAFVLAVVLVRLLRARRTSAR